MIEIKNIVKAVTKVLKDNFSTMPVYADQVDEGHKTPCFFVDIFPVSIKNDSRYIMSVDLMISIDFFSDTRDIVKNYQMITDLRKAFGTTLKVDNRTFTLNDFEIDMVGENKDVYEFSFRTSYKETVLFNDNSKDYDLIKELHYRKVIE